MASKSLKAILIPSISAVHGYAKSLYNIGVVGWYYQFAYCPKLDHFYAFQGLFEGDSQRSGLSFITIEGCFYLIYWEAFLFF